MLFKQHLVTIEMDAAYVNMPESLIQNVTQLLSEQLDDTMAARPKNCHVQEWRVRRSSVLPCLGWNGRTLSPFKCVFENCPSFLDIRAFPDEKRIKWVLMGMSHSHSFTAFPSRIPRNVIPEGVKEELQRMVIEKQSCAAIKMKNEVLCNNDIFKNVVREVHKRMNSEQARALRDLTGRPTLCSSTINATDNHAFSEDFFVNTVLVSKGLTWTSCMLTTLRV